MKIITMNVVGREYIRMQKMWGADRETSFGQCQMIEMGTRTFVTPSSNVSSSSTDIQLPKSYVISEVSVLNLCLTECRVILCCETQTYDIRHSSFQNSHCEVDLAVSLTDCVVSPLKSYYNI